MNLCTCAVFFVLLERPISELWQHKVDFCVSTCLTFTNPATNYILEHCEELSLPT